VISSISVFILNKIQVGESTHHNVWLAAHKNTVCFEAHGVMVYFFSQCRETPASRVVFVDITHDSQGNPQDGSSAALVMMYQNFTSAAIRR
jgi:hypothetical protein